MSHEWWLGNTALHIVSTFPISKYDSQKRLLIFSSPCKCFFNISWKEYLLLIISIALISFDYTVYRFSVSSVVGQIIKSRNVQNSEAHPETASGKSKSAHDSHQRFIADIPLIIQKANRVAVVPMIFRQNQKRGFHRHCPTLCAHMMHFVTDKKSATGNNGSIHV